MPTPIDPAVQRDTFIRQANLHRDVAEREYGSSLRAQAHATLSISYELAINRLERALAANPPDPRPAPQPSLRAYGEDVPTFGGH